MFGGTDWGNMGHPHGYTSYDIGAAIAESRRVHREKYSELKLQANGLQVSPAYLTSVPDNGTFGVFTDKHEIVTTRLAPTEGGGAFYIVRHSDWINHETAEYRVHVPVTGRNVSIPQLGGQLSLSSRDSKVHVVDYDVGGIPLHYSSAEIFTWKKSGSRSVLVLYGGERETHEFAVPTELGPLRVEGDGVIFKNKGDSVVVQWHVEPDRRIVHFGKTLEVHLLW